LTLHSCGFPELYLSCLPDAYRTSWRIWQKAGSRKERPIPLDAMQAGIAYFCGIPRSPASVLPCFPAARKFMWRNTEKMGFRIGWRSVITGG
jgi:hypothetical protein